jgi:hypothetical protein
MKKQSGTRAECRDLFIVFLIVIMPECRYAECRGARPGAYLRVEHLKHATHW